MDMKTRPTKSDIIAAVKKIGEEISVVHVNDVDVNARFPIETISALKEHLVLSAGVPEEFGGCGMTVTELGHLCRVLARYCSSSAMVMGMHFIKVQTIVHFSQEKSELQEYLMRIVREQRLVASVTSEEGIGGNMRTSIAAINKTGKRFQLVKKSSCLSYGAYADDLLITCRNTEESASSDQAVVIAIGDDFSVEQTGIWDSLGMRGTCSAPFIITVDAENHRILHDDFAYVASRTMLPETHIIWANIWLGIALEAGSRARKLLQSKARKAPGKLPMNATDLAKLEVHLDRFRDTIRCISEDYERAHASDDDDYLTSMRFSIKINALKINASEMSAEICTKAMAICGFAGYLNNTPFTIGRLLRDSLSAAPMIGNGRLYEANATHLMITKGEI